jgi:hypothetical protein
MITYNLGLAEARRTSARRGYLHNMITYFLGWRKQGRHQRDKGYLHDMITYNLRIGEGKEDISETRGTSTT